MDIMDDEDKKVLGGVIKWGLIAFLSVILIFAVFSSFVTVPAGHKGVLMTFGAVVGQLNEGLNFKIPFVQSATIINTQTQKYAADASSASSDLQIVSTTVAVNYHLDKSKVSDIYQNVGLEYQDRIIQPAVQESVKANTAKYTASELITKRGDIKSAIEENLKEKLTSYGIYVETVSITNFDFSQDFNAAIEAKQVAVQNAETAKNKLEQVQYEAEQRIAQAKGEADAIAIQAQAINSQGGADYVKLKAIEKWNGIMPNYMMGSTTPFVQIPLGDTQ